LSVPLWRQEEDASIATQEACDHFAQAIAERRTQIGWQPGDFGLMYSGNMGLGHRFQEIIEAMTRLANQPQEPAQPRIRLAFVGGGKRFPEVQKQVQERGLEAVTMHGYVPQKDLMANLCAADLHLVTLEPAWKGLIVPSKLMNVLAAGKPVLYIGHPESEIAKWVREGECGWCVEPDDVDGLMAVLREASSNPDEVRRRGAAARHYAERRFSKAMNAGLLANELLSMIAQRAQSSQATLSEIANRMGEPASLRFGRH
jgi:glycosyltransferase involved in cell wall biosynthesis